MPTTTTVPSVERALQILEVLDTSRRGMNIAELGRKLDIPRSTAHVLVLTLERCGYVTKSASSRNYMLSMKVFNLGREMVQNQKLSEIALEPMKWLSAQARLTSHLAGAGERSGRVCAKGGGSGIHSLRHDSGQADEPALHIGGKGPAGLLPGAAPKGVPVER
ncbi:MAG: helix-turn-helix domain-containing protein [Paludibaculum sp.]